MSASSARKKLFDDALTFRAGRERRIAPRAPVGEFLVGVRAASLLGDHPLDRSEQREHVRVQEDDAVLLERLARGPERSHGRDAGVEPMDRRAP